MHGVWKINNITPSHPSYPVDAYCARPSMTVDWCLHRRLRRKTKKKKFLGLAVGPCEFVFRWRTGSIGLHDDFFMGFLLVPIVGSYHLKCRVAKV